MRRAKVINRTRGTVVGDRIEVAGTSFTRMWGLLGRTGIEAGGGLWIRPSSGVHTMGMKFPIDVVGLDKRLRVVRVWTNLRPFKLTSVSFKVSSIIELAEGRALECNIQVGDIIQIEPTAAEEEGAAGVRSS